jgi:hypothetical protein
LPGLPVLQLQDLLRLEPLKMAHQSAFDYQASHTAILLQLPRLARYGLSPNWRDVPPMALALFLTHLLSCRRFSSLRKTC